MLFSYFSDPLGDYDFRDDKAMLCRRNYRGADLSRFFVMKIFVFYI